MDFIISYDLGTGGTKASLYANGQSIASSFIGCSTRYPSSGRHEQRPEDWWQSVVQSTRALLARTGTDPRRIIALAVSGHSLAAVPVGTDGSLLAEYVPIWSDARASAQAGRFFAQVNEKEWYRTTGNGFPPPLYSVFKIMWLMENHPDIYRKTEKFIGTKDYVNFKMTGRLCTDRSYASGSGLYSLSKEAYEDDYIAASGIDRAKLPDILPSTAVIGTILPDAAEELGLSPSTQVCAGGVDNACMALGAACFENGNVYTSLGSSAWIAVSGDRPVLDDVKRPYVFAHCVPGQYVSATSIFAAGSSFKWLKGILFPGQEDCYAEMDRLAAESPVGANGLFFVPTLAGAGSLDRSPHARGSFAGLELRHTRSDLIRAALEGICMNLRLAMDVLAESVPLNKDMLLVGGGGNSLFWRQLFADIYEKNILENTVGQQAGSLGAAMLAAVGSGICDSFSAVRSFAAVSGCIAPREQEAAVYRRLLPVFAQISDLQSTAGDLIAGLDMKKER